MPQSEPTSTVLQVPSPLKEPVMEFDGASPNEYLGLFGVMGIIAVIFAAFCAFILASTGGGRIRNPFANKNLQIELRGDEPQDS